MCPPDSFMSNYLRRTELKPTRAEYLVSGFFNDSVLLITDYIKFLVERFEAEIYNIQSIYEFRPSQPFREYMLGLAQDRKERSEKGLDTAFPKSCANQAFGTSIYREDRSQTVKIVADNRECAKLATSWRMKDYEVLTCDDMATLWEMSLKKKTIFYKYPSQIGFFVLQSAKVEFLKYVFCFLRKQ